MSSILTLWEAERERPSARTLHSNLQKDVPMSGGGAEAGVPSNIWQAKISYIL